MLLLLMDKGLDSDASHGKTGSMDRGCLLSSCLG
jgi:hypothetical protein